MMAQQNLTINVREPGEGSGSALPFATNTLCTDYVDVLSIVYDDDAASLDIDSVAEVLAGIFRPARAIRAVGLDRSGIERFGATISDTPVIRIFDFPDAGMLEVPGPEHESHDAYDGQEVTIRDAPRVEHIKVGSKAISVFVFDAPNLREVTTVSPTSLVQLSLMMCPMVRLNFQNLQHLSTLNITSCVLQHDLDMNDLRAIRHSLKDFTFVNNAGHPRLSFRGFTTLRNVTVLDCQCVKVLEFNDTNVTHVRVQNCKRFMGVRTRGSAIEWGILHSLVRLIELVIVRCRDFHTISVERMPNLKLLHLEGNKHMYFVQVDGLSCPALEHVKIIHNAKLRDTSCRLRYTFDRLTRLQLDNNRLKVIPPTWDMPALRSLTLSGNRFRDPVDLSMFRSIKEVIMRHTVCPATDRGGERFRVNVIVHEDNADVELVGNRLVLVLEGHHDIDDARLAPILLQPNEVFPVAPPRVVGTPPASDDEPEADADYEGDTADEDEEDEEEGSD